MREGDLYLNENIPGKNILPRCIVVISPFVVVDLVGAKSVYIITDVMKASDIKAVVTGNDDSWLKIDLGSIPIGFGYSKFRLSSDGLVGEQVI